MNEVKDEGYGTHLGPLEWALKNSHGPVLELGMGYHSTPFLRKWCAEHRLPLVSGEHDLEWANRVLTNDGLTVEHYVIQPPKVERLADCPDWNLFPFEKYRWGVALVDQHPSMGRLVAIEALRYQARFIVIHDTDQPLYFYETAIAAFKHKRTFKDAQPWTTVVSEYEPIAY